MNYELHHKRQVVKDTNCSDMPLFALDKDAQAERLLESFNEFWQDGGSIPTRTLTELSY